MNVILSHSQTIKKSSRKNFQNKRKELFYNITLGLATVFLSQFVFVFFLVHCRKTAIDSIMEMNIRFAFDTHTHTKFVHFLLLMCKPIDLCIFFWCINNFVNKFCLMEWFFCCCYSPSDFIRCFLHISWTSAWNIWMFRFYRCFVEYSNIKEFRCGCAWICNIVNVQCSLFSIGIVIVTHPKEKKRNIVKTIPCRCKQTINSKMKNFAKQIFVAADKPNIKIQRKNFNWVIILAYGFHSLT